MMTKNNTPNPTDGRMKDKKVNAISDYLKPNMPLPQYLPYARFLLDADLSHTAKMLYTLLLDRATLSQKNNWVDDQGRIYVIYPLSNLAKDLDCCISSVTRAFTELEKPTLPNECATAFLNPATFCSKFRILCRIAQSQYAPAHKLTVQKRTVRLRKNAHLTNVIRTT